MSSSDSCVIEFIQFLPEKGGNEKARQDTGLGGGRWADGVVCVTVSALSEFAPDFGRPQISRLIGS
jgi:hypothetical protein